MTQVLSFHQNWNKMKELKNILLEESPWLSTAQNESDRRQKLAALFDVKRLDAEIKLQYAKLLKSQKINGAWGWFEGFGESRYITQHIVSGFRHLQKLNFNFKDPEFMLRKAEKYLDESAEEKYQNFTEDTSKVKVFIFTPLDAHYLYTRSYSADSSWRNAPYVRFYLAEARKSFYKTNLYTQAQLALVFYRIGYKEEGKALMESIRQQAHKSKEMGMYWTTSENRYYEWYDAPVERQALFIEAFGEISPDTTEIEMMKQWLLKRKQTQSWANTKATTEAVYALLLNGSNLLTKENNVIVKVGNETFDFADMTGAEAGTGYLKTSWKKDEITPEMSRVLLDKSDEGAAYGAVYWHYFEDMDKISEAATGLSIEKELYKVVVNSMGEQLVKISEESLLHVGDKVIVRMVIKTDRDLEYIHVKDMRASAFEPLNLFSQYKWQGRIGYYESTRDAATNFFIPYLSEGTYVFEYPLRVSQKGEFANGITTIECMYSPEFSAHSNGIRVRVE